MEKFIKKGVLVCHMGDQTRVFEELSEMLSGLEISGPYHDRFREALDYLSMCSDPNTPSHKISPIGLEAVLSFSWPLIPEDKQGAYEALLNQAQQVLRDRGYRSDIFTFQERCLLDLQPGGERAKDPYKPLGVSDGKLSVEETKRARELAKCGSAQGRYFVLDPEEVGVRISLEPLDEDGNTVRDPQLLDDNLNPIPTEYSPDFPYLRD
jgi:hypothetical protein